MADVSGKFFSAKKVRTGVSPSSPGVEQGETLPPVNPPGTSLNSVGLTMPSAFEVANSPLTSNGTIAVTGAGTVGQYIRGDGSLADFPESSGGGSSVSYYLNGSVSQGTIGGVAYKELNKVPILGAGTDFTIAADGYIASFLTDAGDPNLLEIPGGNWNFETYFSASSSGGTPSFYVELYKYNGTTFTLIASSVSAPEFIAFGTILTPYFSSLAVPTTVLALTDRLAVRYYVLHSGRTITLHTENNHLCQIITTFTTGITALNGLTAQVQNFAVGTSGTDFNIASATATHTFNLPTASATNRGALSSSDWSVFNSKIGGSGTSGQVAYFNGTSSITGESSLFWDATNDRLGIGASSPVYNLDLLASSSANSDIFRAGMTGVSNGFTVQRVSSSFTYTFLNGHLLIGNSANSGQQLQVTGTAKITDILTIGTTDNSFIYESGGSLILQTGASADLVIPSSGASTFNSGLNVVGDLTLSSANPFLYGGTAAGSLGLSNIGGESYIRIFGASHATTPNVTQFVNAGSTSLTIASTGAATFSGSVSTPHTTKTANYTLTETDYTVGFDCASNRTAILPDATTCAGRIYVIYQYNTNLGARSVTLDGNGSQTINGLTTYNLLGYCDYSSVMIQSNGSNWIIIANALETCPV